MNPNKPTSSNSNEDSSWEFSEEEKQQFLERKKASELPSIEIFSENIKDLELGFAEQLQKSQKRGEKEMPKKEFLYWEQELRDEWLRLEKSFDRAGIYDYKEQARLSDSLIPNSYRGVDSPNVFKTIEAQSGNFYDDRRFELLQAINNSDDPEKEKDKEVIREFAGKVFAHVDYVNTDNRFSDVNEGRSYDISRTAIHDDAIRCLNRLNDLAEKYGTTRFTPRNFWTSDKRSEEVREAKDRAIYDRDIFEAYYYYAFRYDIEQELAKKSRDFGKFY